MKRYKKSIIFIFVLMLLICLCSCMDSFIHTCEFRYVMTIEPSCTNLGYDIYTCTCGEQENKNYRETIEHSFGEGRIIEATCISEGKVCYTCLNCDYEFISDETIPKKTHQAIVDPQIEATCITTGLTEGSHCAICYTILVEQQETPIKNHMAVTDKLVESTCVTTGLTEGSHCSFCNTILVKQEVIPTKDHYDNDSNGDCDYCHSFLETVISIKTVEELMSIQYNPQGCYRLDRDIDLQGVIWTPICSKNAPFTGKFYGNGHTISGMSSEKQSLGGLFYYNNGCIKDLTIADFVFSVSNTSADIGGIAIINNGTIENCCIKGNFTIKTDYLHVDKTAWPSYPGTKVNYKVSAGSISSVNNGVIKNTKILGYVENHFDVNNEYYLTPSPLFFLGNSLYNSRCTLDLVVGGFVGVNNGQLEDCNNNGINHSVFNVAAKIKSRGLSYSIVNGDIGEITGVNNKVVTNCNANVMTYEKNVQETKVSSNGDDGVICELNLKD